MKQINKIVVRFRSASFVACLVADSARWMENNVACASLLFPRWLIRQERKHYCELKVVAVMGAFNFGVSLLCLLCLIVDHSILESNDGTFIFASVAFVSNF